MKVDNKSMPEHMAALITYMDDNVPLDGTYKVALLKTITSYYESMVHAESMNALIMKSFSNLN